MSEINEDRIKNIEKELEDLKKKVDKLNEEVPRALSSIEKAVGEIKLLIKKNNEIGAKDNEIMDKDVKENTRRIGILEENQNKVIWAIVLAFIGLIGDIAMQFIQQGQP